jgi:hypothetical protein
MSAAGLRGLCSKARLQAKLPAGFQQKRFVGDLPVKPNKYVEDWVTYREHVEETFRWDAKTWRNIAIFGFGVPFAVYQTCVAEFNKSDEKYGRPKRDMWGSVASKAAA